LKWAFVTVNRYREQKCCSILFGAWASLSCIYFWSLWRSPGLLLQWTASGTAGAAKAGCESSPDFAYLQVPNIRSEPPLRLYRPQGGVKYPFPRFAGGETWFNFRFSERLSVCILDVLMLVCIWQPGWTLRSISCLRN
jgi:hypothetical protein